MQALACYISPSNLVKTLEPYMCSYTCRDGLVGVIFMPNAVIVV